MKKIFTSAFILYSLGLVLIPSFAWAADSAVKPNIKITNTPVAKEESQSKPLKVKTTIVTKQAEETEPSPEVDFKKNKKDIDLSSDVDKILKEMDIDDADPVTEVPQGPVEKIYKPVEKNFMWFAFGIILIPIILFVLLVNTMKLAKTRFEKEEKEEGPSKEEQFLDEIQKEQKKTKKKPRSLSEILGGSKQRHVENPAFDNDFDREDEDFEFMVEEVVLVEEHKHEAAPKPPEKKPEKVEVKIEHEKPEKIEPQPQPQPQIHQEQPKIEENKTEESLTSDDDNVIIDSFEISNDLKFLLIKKNEAANLICKLQEREILIIKLEKAQKFNKVRKIDSKPGRDVYMVKLDSWRGLVEIKEDSVKYLMDI